MKKEDFISQIEILKSIREQDEKVRTAIKQLIDPTIYFYLPLKIFAKVEDQWVMTTAKLMGISEEFMKWLLYELGTLELSDDKIELMYIEYKKDINNDR